MIFWMGSPQSEDCHLVRLHGEIPADQLHRARQPHKFPAAGAVRYRRHPFFEFAYVFALHV